MRPVLTAEGLVDAKPRVFASVGAHKSIVAINLHLDEVVATTNGAKLGHDLVVGARNLPQIDIVLHFDELALAESGSGRKGEKPCWSGEPHEEARAISMRR